VALRRIGRQENANFGGGTDDDRLTWRTTALPGRGAEDTQQTEIDITDTRAKNGRY